MIITTIEKADGTVVTRTGDVGITLTGLREGDALEARFEISEDIVSDELIALLGSFITFLDEHFGERFITQIIGHYASETGKRYMEEGGKKIFMIRGKKE